MMKEKINQVRKSPRGRALLFFAFYAVFFVIIFSFIYFSDYSEVSDNMEDFSYPFPVTSLENSNYHFHYVVSTGKTIYEYQGDRFNNQEVFTLGEQSYYFDGNDYYLGNDQNGFLTDNPYLFSEFRNPEVILSLLQSAYFEYKTLYDSGKGVYRFLVDTNLIDKVLENQDTDYFGEANSMLFSIDENNNIEKIVFQLDDYCMKNPTCTDSLKIEMYLDSWGEIPELVEGK